MAQDERANPACGKLGGTLRVLYAEEPKNLHPQIDSGTEGLYVQRQIRDGLMNIDGNGKIVPGLAARMERPDDVTYIFHLRKGVSFHDGTPFDADDVIWTYRRLMGEFPTLPSTQATRFKGAIKSIQKLDQYTVKIVLTRPWDDFLTIMAYDKYQDIMSRAAEEKWGRDYGQKAAVGTGPFKFKEWVKGDRLVLVRNENYWGPRACLDQIVFKAIPEDTTRLLAFRTGKVDVLYDPPLSEIAKLSDRRVYNIQAVDSGDLKLMYFNTTRPPFTNKQVRQALYYAIDRKAIADTVYYGWATVAQGIFPPWHWAYDPKENFFPYNPARAHELLQVAGYNPSNPLKFEIITTNASDLVDTATLIQNQLQQVGIQASVISMDKSAHVARTWPVGGTANPAFQASVYRFKFHYSTSDYAWRVYSSRTALNLFGYNQAGGAQNQEVDRMLDEAQQTVDRPKATVLYRRLSKLITDDAPVIRLVWQKNVNVSLTYVRNLGITVLNFMPLRDVWLARSR